MEVGHLIRVWTDVGARKPVPLLAKIVERNGDIFTIRYLSESDDKIWRYEEDTYEIDSDSIAEVLKTGLEEDLGYRECEDGFIKIKMEDDDDYEPTSASEDECEESDETDEEDEEEIEEEEDEYEEDDSEEEIDDEE